jgi:aminopeptidase N
LVECFLQFLLFFKFKSYLKLKFLSFQPVVSEEPQQGNLRVVKFERTPIMSTYLVAVVVGEFDYVEDVSSKLFNPLAFPAK